MFCVLYICFICLLIACSFVLFALFFHVLCIFCAFPWTNAHKNFQKHMQTNRKQIANKNQTTKQRHNNIAKTNTHKKVVCEIWLCMCMFFAFGLLLFCIVLTCCIVYVLVFVFCGILLQFLCFLICTLLTSCHLCCLFHAFLLRFLVIISECGFAFILLAYESLRFQS